MCLSLLPFNNEYNNNKGALKGPLRTVYLSIIGSMVYLKVQGLI